MKSLTITTLLLLSMNSYSQTTLIPDANFEQSLINQGYDVALDGSVLTANISGLTTLDVSSWAITDLTGIQGFVALTDLDCSDNLLAALDLSQNTALVNLSCGWNAIASLDMSQNPDLLTLDCFTSLVASIDVTQNPLLTNLICESSQLTSLDVTQNPALVELNCAFNSLTNLDLTQNTALMHLMCAQNDITSLDLTQNTALEQAICFSNDITALDLSQCTALTALRCTGNELQCLNVQNGNNTNITFFEAGGNFNLTCIEVDDVAWSTTNWTNIDPQTSFALDCSVECSAGLTDEPINDSKELIKIVDLMGREIEFEANTLMIYLYSDGSSERVFEIGE